jgi:hypothetical protein
MSDTTPAPNGAHAKKAGSKSVNAALVLVLAIAAFAAAFWYVGGVDYVAGLFGGGPKVPGPATPSKPVPGKPATPATPVPEPAVEPTSSVGQVDAGGVQAGGGTSGYALDPAAKRRMFYEQVASRETITELVEGKFASFALGTPSGTGASRSIPVTATYKAGGSFSGTLLLKRYGGAWYFAAIARSGNSLSVTPSSPGVDMAVVNTIVAQQTTNQGLISGIVAGDYDTLAPGTPYGGAGTKTIPIDLTGSPSRTGRIVCVRKVVGPKTYWFITSFKD